MTHQPEPILRRVKCSERLPEKAMENYLTVSSRGTETARFFNGARFETAYYEGEITHWYEPITAVVLAVEEWEEIQNKVSVKTVLSEEDSKKDSKKDLEWWLTQDGMKTHSEEYKEGFKDGWGVCDESIRQ